MGDRLRDFALYLQGAYLFAGDALATAEVLNGAHTRREPKDAYMLARETRNGSSRRMIRTRRIG
ncbi:MAG: hypothetical protein DME04_25340 [Candidatus Rokuibacteriota bacterium]|nr:MAG: hypothetical protein DME04_25340 [Candidatus Rokubacteria bacterium]